MDEFTAARMLYESRSEHMERRVRLVIDLQTELADRKEEGRALK